MLNQEINHSLKTKKEEDIKEIKKDKLYTNLLEKNKINNINNNNNNKKYTKIKPIPFIRNPKSQKNILDWLYKTLYDDYNILYFINIMFEEMITILNDQEYFYKNGEKDIIFTEFINWCYYNSYDF